MKSKILWKASQYQKNKSNLFKYEKFLSSKYKFKANQKYKDLLKWSIKNPKKCFLHKEVLETINSNFC